MKRKRQSAGTAPAKKQAVATKAVAVVVPSPNYNIGRTHPRQPKAELKAFDTSLAANSFGAGTVVALNLMVAGTDIFNRIGRKVYMKSLHLKGQVNPTATSIQDYGRLLIIYDSQANKALPSLADILKDSNAGAVSDAYSDINLDNRERFKILRDLRFQFPSVTFTAGALTNLAVLDVIKQSTNINEFIKLNGLETMYNVTNGGTIADIQSGSLLMLTVDQTGNADYQFIGRARLRFYD